MRGRTSSIVAAALVRAGRVLVVTTAALGAVSVVLAILCVAGGSRPMIFRSGSMGPAIPAGSLAFTRSAPAAEIAVGDVVTVRTEGGVRVTHRVIALDRHADVALLQLKGDANRSADRTIYPVREVQRTWFSVPFAGSLVTFLGSPVGGVVLLAYLLLVLLLLRSWTGTTRSQTSARRAGGAVVRSRLLATGTATLTIVAGGFGGWALPTWAYWTDNATVSGATIATGTWDVAAPSSSLTNVTPAANAAGWFNANITVTLGATDPAPSSGVAGIHYKLNGGTEQVLAGASGTVGITTEGTNTLEFWAVDNAGFIETPHHTATFNLDKTPPPAPAFTAISSDTGSSSSDRITSTVSQTLSGTAEANSTVTVKQGSTVLGTTAANGSGNFTFGPVTLSAGVNTFTATATDVASNTGPASAGFAVTLDNVAPNSVVINPNDSAWHNTNTWTVTASDALSGVASVSYKIGAGSFTTISASNAVPTSPATLPEGTNSVQAYATDVAGVSSSAAPATATIKVDTVKPTAVLNLAGASGNSPWRLGGGANVVGSDATSGVASVEYKIDSGSFVNVVSGTGFTIPDGTHTVTFHAVDFAGNVGTDVVQGVSIDSAAPTTTSSASPAANANTWNSGSVTVTFTPTDPAPGSGVANVQYRTTLNGGTPSSFTTLPGPTYTATISGEGTTVVEFRATDVAGNAEGLKGRTVKIDTVKPTASLNLTGTQGTNSWLLSGTANIVGADATSGVDHVEYQLDGAGAFTSLASGATFTIPEGTHSVVYRAVDVADNVGTSNTVSNVKVDSVNPVLSNPSPANGASGAGWATLNCATAANQLCVSATDATSLVGSVKVALVRTSGTTQCWNGSAFVNGTACSTQPMGVVSGSQYATSGLTAAVMTAGNYQTTYTGTDNAGNTSTLTTTFTITAAAVPATPNVSCSHSGSNYTVSWPAVSGATNYTVVWYVSSNATNTQTVTSLSVVLNPVFGPNGGHPITVTANNASGSSAPATIDSC